MFALFFVILILLSIIHLSFVSAECWVILSLSSVVELALISSDSGFIFIRERASALQLRVPFFIFDLKFKLFECQFPVVIVQYAGTRCMSCVRDQTENHLAVF